MFSASGSGARVEGHDLPSDAELVGLCCEGDPSAWEQLIHRYKRLVWSIPAEYGFDEDEIKDVAQEVWATLLKGIHDLRDPAKVYSWLMTTTDRRCQALAARRPQRVVEHQIEEPRDPARTQEEVLSWTQKQQVLRGILEIWRDPCSRLIQALFFEERRYEEAAQLLGVSPEGIGARRTRCLQWLRRMLADRGVTDIC
jgi:RNA polymerase sigma factor (sigma-70 family)